MRHAIEAPPWIPLHDRRRRRSVELAAAKIATVEAPARRILDNRWMPVVTHALLARAAFRPARIRKRARQSAARVGRRAFRAFRVAPPGIRLIAAVVLLVLAWVPVNWMVQVVRKPAEVFGAVSPSSAKVPAHTWQQYGSLFDAHSTAVVTPELLAALAQVESSGNPAALTYWRWRFSWNPFELYRPASSAVGMFQLTDGTFAEARRYCVHDHVVVEDGPWNDLRSCWFNALYTRVVPAHAVEMTAALLDRAVARSLARNRVPAASLQQRQDLAAIIHLCGGGAGDGYVRRGFRFSGGQRCGDHDPRRYLSHVNTLKRQFAQLAAAD
jgi:Transglycosylase SLT domain